MANLDELARAGLKAIEERRYDDAIQSFKSALTIDPTRPDLNNALGMAHLHRGEAGTALPYLAHAVELAEPYTDERVQDTKLQFHLGLATAHELLDQVASAVRVLEGAVERWPSKVEASLQLAQLLLGCCRLEEGVAVYRRLAEHHGLDADQQKAASVVADAIRAFQESEQSPLVFLQGHAESYRSYFEEVTKESLQNGWYAEAARMARDKATGEVKPVLPSGARPYAMQRIDIVNPADGTAASVYSEQEPMVVALNGLEPLAQIAILFPHKGEPFETWVSSRCPWHWLTVTVQFTRPDSDAALDDDLDPVVGDWYLSGFNGEFGDKDAGRFHFIGDPEVIGDRAVSYTVDLGRARFDAIGALLRRLAVLHDKRPIQRVLFGQGRLPD